MYIYIYIYVYIYICIMGKRVFSHQANREHARFSCSVHSSVFPASINSCVLPGVFDLVEKDTLPQMSTFM